MKQYFHELIESVGDGWNRFWFTPGDPFPLAVIRIPTALVALVLYLTYIPDLVNWFGPNGLISLEYLRQLHGSTPVFSIFYAADSVQTLWIIYWLGAAALVLFLVGLFTRVTAVLALVALLSILHRGPVLARPVDDITAMVMFYLCLGPCGAALSLDARLWKRREPESGAQSVATTPAVGRPSTATTISLRLMQVHLTAVYAAMALAKIKSPVWWNGTAVWGLIAKPDSRMFDLTWLAADKYVYLVNLWTYAIVAFELCFALLIWNRLARPLLLGISLVVWLGTAVLTGMVTWALIMLIAGLAFVPATALRAYFRPRTP